MDQDAWLVSEFENLSGVGRHLAQFRRDHRVLRRLDDLRRRHESENWIDDRAEGSDGGAAQQVVQKTATGWRCRVRGHRTQALLRVLSYKQIPASAFILSWSLAMTTSLLINH